MLIRLAYRFNLTQPVLLSRRAISFNMSSSNDDVINVSDNLNRVNDRLRQAYEGADSKSRAPRMPRLVAVSKTKPKELVIQAYQAGHRHFGENYIQELVDKSNDPELQSSCPDIRWHFIGTCQSNKASKLCKCPNLDTVETVTSAKLADKLQSQAKQAGSKLKVMIQVNTSGEENKNGVDPSEAPSVATHISKNCPDLTVCGVMTIGALARSIESAKRAAECEQGHNPDFLSLIQARDEVAKALGVQPSDLELSMGMSGDFEEAVRMGSTSVRVGSSIFGARNYEPPKTTDVEKQVANVKIS